MNNSPPVNSFGCPNLLVRFLIHALRKMFAAISPYIIMCYPFKYKFKTIVSEINFSYPSEGYIYVSIHSYMCIFIPNCVYRIVQILLVVTDTVLVFYSTAP